MTNQELIQRGLGRVRLLLGLAILLAIWHQCRGTANDRMPCERDIIPTNCRTRIVEEDIDGCPKHLCLKGPGESCFKTGNYDLCEKGLTCRCGRCMNCILDDCSIDINCFDADYTKRFPNRLLPWFSRLRLPNLSQQLKQPNYDY